MNQNILSYRGVKPQVDETVYVAPGVFVIGDVSIGACANIWYNTVLRGDIQPIKIGKYTNIQDNSTVHVMYDHPAIIGDYVTVGHGAIIHGCSVGNNCLIGMGAIILGYAEIGDNCIIAAGSLIPERKKIPPNSLVMGSPGKVVRTLTEEEIQGIRESALKYHKVAKNYQE
ncbi:gamma carbonic anhydrase family protein [bacterium BFN5]|nr:gamma carbonic anhydrase family protein [bacterium BFN5]QJW44444.1 gamma carbonic anhydrase family protein [bacterium BFN5]